MSSFAGVFATEHKTHGLDFPQWNLQPGDTNTVYDTAPTPIYAFTEFEELFILDLGFEKENWEYLLDPVWNVEPSEGNPGDLRYIRRWTWNTQEFDAEIVLQMGERIPLIAQRNLIKQTLASQIGVLQRTRSTVVEPRNRLAIVRGDLDEAAYRLDKLDTEIQNLALGMYIMTPPTSLVEVEPGVWRGQSPWLIDNDPT